MCDYSQNDIQNIDLAYTYTENYLKDRRNEISNLKVRLGTFLGFAGLLLRFNIDLPSSQPSYLLTKIGALVTSFFSIAILAWALRAYMGGEILDPSVLIKDVYFQAQNADIKLEIINKHTKACYDIYSSIDKQIKLLNLAINFLLFSAFFFTVNGVLVSFLGK